MALQSFSSDETLLVDEKNYIFIYFIISSIQVGKDWQLLEN